MSQPLEPQTATGIGISLADADRGRRHIFGLDLIRALAIVMVVFDHTLPLVPNGPLNRFVWSLTGPDASIFYMLSGALLLPVTCSYGRFIWRRTLRVFVPFLVWSAIYILAEYYDLGATEYWTIHRLKWMWLSSMFSAGWFVPVMMGIYLMMPILSPWIAQATRAQLLYFLGIFVIAGLTPWLQIFTSFNPTGTFYGPFYNYIGYAIAGYYFMRYPLGMRPSPTPSPHCLSQKPGLPDGTEKHHLGIYFNRLATWAMSHPVRWYERYRTAVLISGLVVVGLIFPLYISYFPGHQNVLPKLTHGISVSSIALGWLMFTLLSPLKSGSRVINYVVSLVARNAYGIYLGHTLVMYLLSTRVSASFEGSWIFLPVTFVISLIAIELLSRIPIVNKLLT